MATRAEILKEMDSAVNPLIPGGKAAQIAEANTLHTDKGPDADNRRLMSGLYNPLVVGSPRQHEF